MRKRLKKIDWRFWLSAMLGLGLFVSIVVMAWKLMPEPGIVKFAIAIPGFILGLSPAIQVRRLARKEGEDQVNHP